MDIYAIFMFFFVEEIMGVTRKWGNVKKYAIYINSGIRLWKMNINSLHT